MIIPVDDPRLRCAYLQERARAYGCIITGPPAKDLAQDVELFNTREEIRKDVLRSLAEAIKLADLIAEKKLKWELLWQQVKYLCLFGKLEAAKQAIFRADSLKVGPLPLLQEPELLSMRAFVAKLDGQHEQALALYKEASDAMMNAPHPRLRLTAKLYLANRAQLLISLSAGKRPSSSWQQAISCEEEYLAEYEQRYQPIQDEYTVINLKGHLGWLSDFTQPIYADMACVCAHLQNRAASFEYSERARASYMRQRLHVLPDCTNVMRHSRESADAAFVQYLIHDRESLCYVANIRISGSLHTGGRRIN